MAQFYFTINIGFITFISFVIPKLIERKFDKKDDIKQIDFESKYAIKKYNYLKESMIYSDGIYHIDFTNYFDKEELDFQILYKYLYDVMSNQEVRLIYDSTNPDETVFLAFKHMDKIMLEIAFIDNEGNIVINEDLISWAFPKFSEFSKIDKQIFYQSINKYSKAYNVNFIYENFNKSKHKRKRNR